MTDQQEIRQDMPKFSAIMKVEAPGITPQVFTFSDDPPKELMDEYQQIIGNGLARVSVSADMSLKDFGRGVSSMCTVSLSCNQDVQTIQRALSLAGHIARWYAKENRQLADAELQNIVAQQNPQVGRPNFG